MWLGGGLRLQEVQALASLGSHTNIVRYFGAWIECDWLYVQMEMCESCLSSQQSTQRSFGEAQIKQLLREIGSALDHMHGRGLVHLDIKPENVFFQKGASAENERAIPVGDVLQEHVLSKPADWSALDISADPQSPVG